MQRNFIINLFFLLFLNLLIKPFWIFGIDRGVQNSVGPDNYGIYFTLFSFTLIFYFFVDFGLTNFNNKSIAQNNNLIHEYFPKLFTLKLILGAIYLAITILAATVLNYSSNEIKFLSILTFNQFLTSLILYLRSNISALHFFKLDSLLSVLDRLVLILLCGTFLYSPGLKNHVTILSFAYAQTISLLISSVIAFACVVKYTNRVFLSWDPQFFYKILKDSLPFAILVLLMAFYNRIDSILLERLLPDGKLQAGIYAQAFRVLDAANMIAYLFAALLIPMFSKQIHKPKEVIKLAEFSFKLTYCLSLGVTIICVMFAKEIIQLLYVNEIDSASQVLAILMACFIGSSTTYIYGSLLTANGSLKQLNIIAIFGMLVNLGVNFLAIPYYKAIGSAYTSVITQVGLGFIQMAMAYKILKVKVNPEFIKSLIIYTIIVLLFSFGINFINIYWLYKIFLLVLILLVLLLPLKMFDAKQIFDFLKNMKSNKAIDNNI